MFPLLVQLGMALAGGIAQKIEGDNQYEKDKSKHNTDFVQDIMNKRASRAGDSMYMQNALASRNSMPEAPPSPFPGVVAGMGGALLGYNGNSGGGVGGLGSALSSAVGPQGWRNPAVSGDRAGYDAAKSGEKWRWDEDKYGDGAGF